MCPQIGTGIEQNERRAISSSTQVKSSLEWEIKESAQFRGKDFRFIRADNSIFVRHRLQQPICESSLFPDVSRASLIKMPFFRSF